MPPRFFHDSNLSVGQTLELTLTTGHHVARVLRAKTGDSVILFNGTGGEFTAHIENIRKAVTTVTVAQHHAIERESPLTITLAQALCVNEKMDWIIQKSVELGVTHIQPVTTTRSIVRLSEDRARKRLQHWQRVTIAACEQCGRNTVPIVSELMSLTDWISVRKPGISDYYNFMLSPTGNNSLTRLSTSASPTCLTLAVGPEGGFTADEETILQQAGFLSLQMGKRILRTETAALAAISAFQMQWGDF